MTTTILAAVKTLLKTDHTLQTLLGGQYVTVENIAKIKQFPAVTLAVRSEGSKKRTGYRTIKKRDNATILAVDIWSNTTKILTYQVADRIDALLVADTVPGTRSWQKVSDSDLFEDDTQVFHKALNFQFKYTLNDA